MGQTWDPTQHGQRKHWRKTRCKRQGEKCGHLRARRQGGNMTGRAKTVPLEGAGRSALRPGKGKSFTVEQAGSGPSSPARA